MCGARIDLAEYVAIHAYNEFMHQFMHQFMFQFMQAYDYNYELI
jgi:hypothetical protein